MKVLLCVFFLSTLTVKSVYSTNLETDDHVESDFDPNAFDSLADSGFLNRLHLAKADPSTDPEYLADLEERVKRARSENVQELKALTESKKSKESKVSIYSKDSKESKEIIESSKAPKTPISRKFDPRAVETYCNTHLNKYQTELQNRDEKAFTNLIIMDEDFFKFQEEFLAALEQDDVLEEEPREQQDNIFDAEQPLITEETDEKNNSPQKTTAEPEETSSTLSKEPKGAFNKPPPANSNQPTTETNNILLVIFISIASITVYVLLGLIIYYLYRRCRTAPKIDEMSVPEPKLPSKGAYIVPDEKKAFYYKD